MQTFSPTIWYINNGEDFVPVLTLCGRSPKEAPYYMERRACKAHARDVERALSDQGSVYGLNSDELHDTPYSLSDFRIDLDELENEECFNAPELAAAVREMLEMEAA